MLVALLLGAMFSPAATAEAPDVVVMIHGAGGGGWEYDRWRPVFERAGWKVIANDLKPGRNGLAATRFADYAAQARQWTQIPHRRLVLVGASLGGILALSVAARAQPDALILVNSVAPRGVGKRPRGRRAPAIVRWAGGPIAETRAALPDGDEETVRWAHARWRDESGAVLNEVRAGVRVGRPAAPALVVIGAADTDVPPETGLALARWARADVHLYARTSHIGPLFGRRAAEIAGAAVRWLEARRQPR